MTSTFESDNDIIVYEIEKIISYARRTQPIFVAQCVSWLASMIGLEQRLASYIDNIQSRLDVSVIPEEAPSIGKPVSPTPRDNQEERRRDLVLQDCEMFLQDSPQSREIASLKSKGKTHTGRINPSSISKKHLRKKDRKPASERLTKETSQKADPMTEGIVLS
jgi:hypothetical protein